eukprot:3612173-Lingulodinium_polyedra.AAC.1
MEAYPVHRGPIRHPPPKHGRPTVGHARQRWHQGDLLGRPTRPREANLDRDVVATRFENGFQVAAELWPVNGASPGPR